MIYSLHLGLSYKCNMACAHCFVSKAKDKLKLQDILNLINAIKDKGLFVIYYTFGEPTISEMLEPLLFEISKMNMVQIVMSNGFAITEDVADMLKKRNASRVFISIDHYLPEMHDKNRGVASAFSQALKAIGYLQERGVPTGIATTVTKQNENTLNEILSLAKNYKVNLVSFLRERKNGSIEKNGYDEYYKFARKIISDGSSGVTVQFHDPTLKDLIDELYRNGEVDLKQYERWYAMNSCHYASTLAVAPNGDVMHCHLSQRVIGNVFEDKISDVIDREVKVNECPVCCAKLSG